jgi:hypothetical protein
MSGNTRPDGGVDGFRCGTMDRFTKLNTSLAIDGQKPCTV